MSLLPLFNKNRTGQYDAVVLDDQGVSVARLDNSGAQPQLISADYQATAEETPAALASLLKRQHLKSAPVTTLLAIGDYQLLLVEAPNVPQDELKAAVRWQVKDLIDFHIDDAVVDVFDAPPSPSRAQQQLYVVVSRQETVRQLSEQLTGQGLELAVIDIPELALRNLAALLPDADQGVAMLYLSARRGLIAVCRNGVLYLARSIELGYQTLADGHDELLNTLALEVQRTLDYDDRYFQQAPVSQLLLMPTPVELPEFLPAIQGHLGLNTRAFPLRELLAVPDSVDDAILGHCALAIGAALRREKKSL